MKEGRKDKEGNDCVYDEYDIMARMKEHHWQIPAYTLPDNAKWVFSLHLDAHCHTWVVSCGAAMSSSNARHS